MIYLTNAFSLSMLPSVEGSIEYRRVTVEEVRKILTSSWVSAIGHDSTATVLQELLFLEVPVNRIQVKLERGDTLVVFQLLSRLPEGKVLSRDEILSLPFAFYIIRGA